MPQRVVPRRVSRRRRRLPQRRRSRRLFGRAETCGPQRGGRRQFPPPRSLAVVDSFVGRRRPCDAAPVAIRLRRRGYVGRFLERLRLGRKQHRFLVALRRQQSPQRRRWPPARTPAERVVGGRSGVDVGLCYRRDAGQQRGECQHAGGFRSGVGRVERARRRLCRREIAHLPRLDGCDDVGSSEAAGRLRRAGGGGSLSWAASPLLRLSQEARLHRVVAEVDAHVTQSLRREAVVARRRTYHYLVVHVRNEGLEAEHDHPNAQVRLAAAQ
mmetsp:Transcript_38540/g.98552  ORF Transcript_38540/g.98552 Transcript_38540/m.98552 type:complete len:270 (+) Transcript_38540:897-1706(+)